MAFTETLTQGFSFIDVLNTSAPNNFTLNTIGVDMSKFKRVIYYIGNQGLGAAGTIDGRLQSAAATSFATAHNISTTNITQQTVNNTWSSVEVRSDQVTSANSGDRYVRLNLTTGGNALTGLVVVAFGAQSEQAPASQYNLASGNLASQTVCSL